MAPQERVSSTDLKRGLVLFPSACLLGKRRAKQCTPNSRMLMRDLLAQWWCIVAYMCFRGTREGWTCVFDKKASQKVGAMLRQMLTQGSGQVGLSWCQAFHESGEFPRKTKGQQLKGKIALALFHTFSHFSTLFHTFSHFFPRTFLQIKAFFKPIKKKKTKPFCTLVVARLSSSKNFPNFFPATPERIPATATAFSRSLYVTHSQAPFPAAPK